MLHMRCWSGVLILTLASAAVAKEFPLQYKTIKGRDLATFPGGSGVYCPLTLGKPAELKKEPKAISKHAIYGRVRTDSNQELYLFRLDESKGDGKGYDHLLMDLNQNNDLTDDAVIKPNTGFFEVRRKLPPNRQEERFGPIEVPSKKQFGKGTLLYYAQVQINRADFSKMKENNGNIWLGMLSFKAGWYLETTVEMPGVKQKIGVYDANCDTRLGEAWKPETYRSGSEENWYFQTRDSFLVDLDKSGRFVQNPIYSESCSFGPVLYLGEKPYKVSLANDCKSIQVEPWTDPVVEVTIQPAGEQVRMINLAWEYPAGEWKLLEPTVKNGKMLLPAGNYRLYSCVLAPTAGLREQVIASGYQRIVKKPFEFGAGKANTLTCGGPLEVTVKAEKEQSRDTIIVLDAKGNRTLRNVSPTNYLSISAVTRGAGGEIYSSFGKGKDFASNPPKPVVTAFDSKGNELVSGNLEFG